MTPEFRRALDRNPEFDPDVGLRYLIKLCENWRTDVRLPETVNAKFVSEMDRLIAGWVRDYYGECAHVRLDDGREIHLTLKGLH